MLSIADYYMNGWRNDAKTSPTFAFNIYFYLVHIYFAFNTSTNLLECTFGLVHIVLTALHIAALAHIKTAYTHSDENTVTID